ncbi:MAG: MBL fold metallo-hydrolase, partial [Candidatus Dormibacteraceae bacterium]
MEITWYGQGCFRLRGRSAAVLTDPGPFTNSKKLSRLESEVVTTSSAAGYQPHPQKAGKPAFVISGAGEY